MLTTQVRTVAFSPPSPPSELRELLDAVQRLPLNYREALLPAVTEAIEQAKFRSNALCLATEALERLRLDLEMTRFDLDLTRIEREAARSA